MTAVRTSHRLDLLNWPVLGFLLRWRHARTAMQVPLALLAGLMIFDGLVGPQLAPKNLATVGAWLHYRGLVVLVLLLAGNLFCMACPFMLPRQVGRWLRERFLRGGWMVPSLLRNKWLAIGLIVIFFYCYERFSLWASPWLTAWVVIGYFLVALAVDSICRGAAFCKYVCPLGQFNFFGALNSPLEVAVRDGAVCARCSTKDCIRGRRACAGGSGSPQMPGLGHPARSGSPLRGCELWLYLPRKAGNMDCTFCLDCIHACPYDNIGLIARAPTSELWADPYRSGIGRFSHRADLAALVVVFTFGAFLNAFNMIRPVYAFQEALARWFGTTSPVPGLALAFLIGLVILPALLLAAAAAGTRLLAGNAGERLAGIALRYVHALVPMGFGMWLAHYAFHFLTGGLTIVPVVQSFLADAGLFAGRVQWGLGAVVPADWLFPIEALLLYLGALGSIVAVFQIARRSLPAARGDERAAVLAAAAPWIVLVALLLAFGLWIMLQPMEMRGTMQMVRGGG